MVASCCVFSCFFHCVSISPGWWKNDHIQTYPNQGASYHHFDLVNVSSGIGFLDAKCPDLVSFWPNSPHIHVLYTSVYYTLQAWTSFSQIGHFTLPSGEILPHLINRWDQNSACGTWHSASQQKLQMSSMLGTIVFLKNKYYIYR